MKVLDVDWEAFLGFMEAWQGLSLPMRRLVLGMEPKAILPRGQLGDALEPLLRGRFLAGMSDGKRVQLTKGFHETHKVLRALARHPLLARADGRALTAYLGEHLTHEERQALLPAGGAQWNPDAAVHAQLTSVGYVRGFLAAPDGKAWERERMSNGRWWGRGGARPPARLATPNAAADLVRLLEALVASAEPLPFRGLAERLGLPRARVAAALAAGLRYVLCFATLDAELAPVLTLWPSIGARLRRVPARAPLPVEPHESFCLAYRVEDLTRVLVRAAEPLRLKADGRTLFAAAQRELEELLLPLPGWLVDARVFPENAPSARVRAALRLARQLALAGPTGERGRGRGFGTTAAGWSWLELDPHARLEGILDLRRPHPERSDSEAGRALSLAEELEELDELDDILDDILDDEAADEDAPHGFDPLDLAAPERLSDAGLFGGFVVPGAARAALAAYALLEPGRPVRFLDFLRHHGEGPNPFQHAARTDFGYDSRLATDEVLEAHWIAGLQRVLHDHLLPFGGVSVGLTGARDLTVELTPVGRYLLGFADAFTLDAPAPVERPARVQPDFEVVFVARHPGLEATFGRFAERRGTGVGVLFRITRASILAAAQAGLAADEVLTTLERACATPVPANVVHEIRAWFASCRRLQLEPVHLVRCPDAETAVRVLVAAGAGKLERVTDTVLALRDATQKSAVQRACRKAGLFLTDGGAVDASGSRSARNAARAPR